MVLIKNLSDPFAFTMLKLFEYKNGTYILPYIGSIYLNEHNYLALIKDNLL